MFSYPLECFVCRDVIENTFFSKKKGDNKLHTIITVIVIIIAMLISFLTDCLGVVLEINGALIATTLGYIMPSLCAILINYRSDKNYLEMIKPVVVLTIGVVVVVSGVVSVIHKIMNGYDCSHGSEMNYCKKLNKELFSSFVNNNRTKMFNLTVNNFELFLNSNNFTTNLRN